jgi:hypothetical protein
MIHRRSRTRSLAPSSLTPARPLRVFVGAIEVSGFTSELAGGLRAAGHAVTTGVRYTHTNFPDRRYDLDLADDTDAVDWDDLAREARGGPLRAPRHLPRRGTATDRARWILQHHDAFVFVYGSLRRDRRTTMRWEGQGREYALLRRLGKRIVSYFVGPDVRHASAYDQQLAALGGHCLPLGDILPTWGEDPVARPLRNLRRAECYADAIFSQPNQAGLALRPYAHVHAPLELARFRAEVPGREVPVVIHAPSAKAIKGTEAVVAALDALRAERVRFEFRLLHDVPNAQVVDALGDADVVIDQLHLPMHGRLGVEAMASGCALATADRRDLEPVPADRPVFPIDPVNLVRQLRALLTDRALRIRLGHEGIAHARRHHDHVAVARRVIACATDPAAPLEHAPTFFARDYRLPEGVTLPTRVKALTERVVRRWGLPAGVTAADLRARGLM